MKRKCPNCNEKIEYLQVSKQIEGTQDLSCLDKKEPEHPIVWNEDQKEPLIYTCPECMVEIEDETLEEQKVKINV